MWLRLISGFFENIRGRKFAAISMSEKTWPIEISSERCFKMKKRDLVAFIILIILASVFFVSAESFTNDQYVRDVKEKFNATPVQNTTVGQYDLAACAGIPRLKKITAEDRNHTASLFGKDLIPSLYKWKIVIPNTTIEACRVNFYEGPQIIETWGTDHKVASAIGFGTDDEIYLINISTGRVVGKLILENCSNFHV